MNRKNITLFLLITMLFSSCILNKILDVRMTKWSHSSSVEESKEREVFIAQYYAADYSALEDSLSKYDLQFNFDSVVFWLEHEHELDFTFWGQKITKYPNRYAIWYINPAILKYPYSKPAFVVEFESTHLRSRQMHQIYCRLSFKEIPPDTVVANAYLYFDEWKNNCPKIGELYLIRDSVYLKANPAQ